jgi:MFS family permease
MAVGAPSVELEPARRRQPLGRNRDFTLLWTGQALSMLGSRVTSIAYPFLVLSLGYSAGAAGVVGFVAALPYLLFQLPAGVWVDRTDRKRLMIRCDIVRGLALASVAVTVVLGISTLPQIAAVAFVEGSMFVLFTAAERSAIANVVEPEQLTAALSVNEARTRAAGLAGAPLGGVLFGLGRALPFVVDAVSYLASVVTLALIKSEFQTEREVRRRHFGRELVEGFSWLARHRFLLDASISVSLGNLVVRANQLLIIVLATERGIGSGVVGLMLATAGLGGVLGSLLAPPVQGRLSPRAVVIGASLLWAVLFPLFTGNTNPWVFGFAWGGAAFVGAVWNVVVGSYQLAVCPDELRGRVASIGHLMAYGAMALGALLSGALISAAGPEGATWALRAAIVVVALATVADPHIRSGEDRRCENRSARAVV